MSVFVRNKYDFSQYMKVYFHFNEKPLLIFRMPVLTKVLYLTLNVNIHLLVFPPKEKINGHKGANSYIRLGESMGVNKGYKTGIRDNWFVIPSIKLSDALFISRNNLYPRLILNEAKAYATDTMHRVFMKKDTIKNTFIASFYNSLSLAFSKIVGRSYGGGVLELMPSKAEKILLPYQTENAELLAIIDKMMRDKKSIDEILKITNKQILKDGYGFTDKEIKIADSVVFI